MMSGCALLDGLLNESADADPAEMSEAPDMVGLDMGPGGDMSSVPLRGVPVQVSVGRDFACALFDTGEVRCWGDNRFGQLGDDYLFELRTSAETSVIGVSRAVQLSAGHRHVCAVTRAGEVYCWGNNEKGQLGQFNRAGDLPVPSPASSKVAMKVDLGAGNVATSVSAGFAHTCVTLTGGQGLCWGEARWGKLGGPSEGDPSPPVAVLGANNSVVTGFTHVLAGENQSVALRSDGLVMSWGYNVHGELGRPTEQLQSNEANLVVGVTGAIAFSIAGRYGCAVMKAASEDGKVSCWGVVARESRCLNGNT
jgi:alpha-tubulin suppressor-like RCC1 family protein